MNDATYPTNRGARHFAHKFTRLLFRSCVAAQLGPDATLLLIAIAHCEDARRYTGPVSYYAANLADQIGLSVSSMERARSRAVAAGWLNYTPGAKRRAARYFVTIPDSESAKPDGPLDEDEPDFLCQTDGVSGEHLMEKAVGKRGVSDGESGEQANHLLPSPSSSPLPEECANRNGSPATDAKTPKRKKSTEAKRPSGPHQEAVAAFCDQWQAKYGVPYTFAGKKDGQHVKDMLAELGGDVARFRAVVSRYLGNGDEFFREAGHPIGVLRSQFNRFKIDPAMIGTQRPALVNPREPQRHDIAPPLLAHMRPEGEPAGPIAKERF